MSVTCFTQYKDSKNAQNKYREDDGFMGYFGGITLRSGRRGFAVYRDGKVVAQFIPILLGCRMDLIDYQRLMSFCPVK
jgi:hypothetical protein